MQIYVDPSYPTQALDDVQMQLKMLRCLLSQGGDKGLDLDDEALSGMCALLTACAEAIQEAAELTRPFATGRAA